MKILFVENHSLFATIVTKQFLSDHEVTVVPTIDKAQQQISENQFDVMLVDYDLDDGQGDALVENVRQSHLPVKIIAVSSRPEGNERLLAAGADVACGKMSFHHIEDVFKRLLLL